LFFSQNALKSRKRNWTRSPACLTKNLCLFWMLYQPPLASQVPTVHQAWLNRQLPAVGPPTTPRRPRPPPPGDHRSWCVTRCDGTAAFSLRACRAGILRPGSRASGRRPSSSARLLPAPHAPPPQLSHSTSSPLFIYIISPCRAVLADPVHRGEEEVCCPSPPFLVCLTTPVPQHCNQCCASDRVTYVITGVSLSE
jgi:hypothetical protein